jgi:integration host factor subunit beta
MMGKTTKADLIEAIHTNGNLNRKEVHGFIDALFDEIKGAMLAGKTVELRGFGTFEVRKRKGRKRARNPKTGEIVAVEDHGVAAFRPGRELKNGAWHTKPNGLGQD